MMSRNNEATRGVFAPKSAKTPRVIGL